MGIFVLSKDQTFRIFATFLDPVKFFILVIHLVTKKVKIFHSATFLSAYFTPLEPNQIAPIPKRPLKGSTEFPPLYQKIKSNLRSEMIFSNLKYHLSAYFFLT
jgi:hypothetical protein